MAYNIVRPEAPSTSVATEASLILASSNIFWIRFASLTLSSLSLTR
jgi:hypothetical protein